DHGPMGLARYLAGLQDELAPAPIEFNAMDVEHCLCLSRFSRRGESHEQDGERLSRASVARTKTASSDPAMALGPSLARTGDLRPSLKSATASLPDEMAADYTLRLMDARNGPARERSQRRMPSRSINDL